MFTNSFEKYYIERAVGSWADRRNCLQISREIFEEMYWDRRSKYISYQINSILFLFEIQIRFDKKYVVKHGIID